MSINYSFIKNFILILLLFIIVAVLINIDLINHFLWKSLNIFDDWRITIDFLKCNSLGFDIYNNETNSCLDYKMSYGRILLLIPYNENLFKLYYIYTPYLLIFTSIFLIHKIILPQSIVEWIIFLLCIFNPSTLLLYERANIDLLIFCLVIICIYNRYYLVNWFLYFFISFVKIYPSFIFVNFFMEDINRSKKKMIIFALSLFFLFMIYLLYNYEYDLLAFFGDGATAGKPGYQFIWSLNYLSKIIKYIFNLNYIFSLFIVFIIFLAITKKILKTSLIQEKNVNLSFTLKKDDRLFLIGSYICLFCYFFFSNWTYREIFLILTIPYLLNVYKDTDFYNLLSGLIILRYIFSFIYSYANINIPILYVGGERILPTTLISILLIKACLDFILMSIIMALSIVKSKQFLKYLKIKFSY
tara:strand:+ start:116 stop:1360 length:1245 start_codon:yes stop_codon:yes gene_type:complete